MVEETHFYTCDPKLNVYCRKTHCYLNGGACSLTTEKEYSADNQQLMPNEGWGSRATHVTWVKETKRNFKNKT